MAGDRLGEMIDGFLSAMEYLPDDEYREAILKDLCWEISYVLNPWDSEPYCEPHYVPLFDDEDESEDIDEPEEPEPERVLIPDAGLRTVFDGIVAEIVADLKQEGIELPTFMETLLIAETERLIIRRFYGRDLDALWKIMGKPEVMYAWESGFKKREVRKWLNRIHAGYRKDGYSYFAVTLKDTGRLIGQAGLMKQDLNGETIVQIGYIFDNSVWGQGYAIEAARACVDLAFSRFGIERLYATIRPENAASVRLAKKLGMRKIGETVKTYKEKEMPHDIYYLERM